MKEVIAVIRQNKVNVTKEALASAGYPAFTCRKALGRGKKAIDPAIAMAIFESGEVPVSSVGENFTEALRLIPKRIFTLMVEDEDVEKIISTITETNTTGNPGDGKIFVLPIMESIRVREAE